MSGNSYQKYKMQRVGKPSKVLEARRASVSSVHVTASEEIAVKIQRISDQSRIPTQIIATEAIRRGMAVLVKC